MKCLIETCGYEAKHDADMSVHANQAHGLFFRRGIDGAEFIYLVPPRNTKYENGKLRDSLPT